jgi:hypothetical protein
MIVTFNTELGTVEQEGMDSVEDLKTLSTLYDLFMEELINRPIQKPIPTHR